MPLVLHNSDIICRVIPRVWPVPESEYVGPILAVGHVPRDLASLRRGDVQGFEANFWLPVDYSLVSLIIQST